MKRQIDPSIDPADAAQLVKVMSEFINGVGKMADVENGVSIFGSARLPDEHPYCQQATELATKLAEKGFAVITGGGPSIMRAANKGAKQAGGESVGLNITLPFEEEPNQQQTISVPHDYFFVRKVMFVKYSMAYVFMPGGFGTLDELYEVLNLVITGKINQGPVILFGTAFWSGLVDWMREQLLSIGTISQENLDVITITDSIDEVIEQIQQYQLNS